MGVLDETGQQGELATGDRHRYAVPFELAAGQIKAAIAKTKWLDGGGRRAAGGQGVAAAQHRLDAGAEFAGQEGLGEVIVGALLQPDDAIDAIGPGGQHHHRQAVAGIAQAPQQAEPVFAGQHQIEHQQVGPLALEAGHQLRPVLEGAHLVAEFTQVGGQHAAQFRIVIHHPDPRRSGHGLGLQGAAIGNDAHQLGGADHPLGMDQQHGPGLGAGAEGGLDRLEQAAAPEGG